MGSAVAIVYLYNQLLYIYVFSKINICIYYLLYTYDSSNTGKIAYNDRLLMGYSWDVDQRDINVVVNK